MRLQHMSATHYLRLLALPLFITLAQPALAQPQPPPDHAVLAVNQLGIDLHQRFARAQPNANLLLSPFSIQSALAMTWAGADGQTRDEMARVLHFQGAEAALHQSFHSLRLALDSIATPPPTPLPPDPSPTPRKNPSAADPISLHIANRLFGQIGYPILQPFLDLTANSYRAPFETLDFINASPAATRHINQWVEGQTQSRISDLIPAGLLTPDTRLVLVNALHFKAPWSESFQTEATRPAPFHLTSGSPTSVPTLHAVRRFGHRQFDGFQAVSLPYSGDQLQFVILLPDPTNNLSAIESRLTPDLLSEFTRLPSVELDFALPKLRMKPPSLTLGAELQAMGMKSAFNIPSGSANFDRITPRRPDELLCISEVIHKTFLELDEQGTEAAAATAVVMIRSTSLPLPKPRPLVVRVDRPFAFAIQHVDSGACLFIGRVTDPR
jgi:serpin B